MVFPLSPRAERRRIVEEFDELMALCDRLETSLTAAAETYRCLLDAVLAEALAGERETPLQLLIQELQGRNIARSQIDGIILIPLRR